jgi:hypothetical protein
MICVVVFSIENTNHCVAALSHGKWKSAGSLEENTQEKMDTMFGNPGLCFDSSLQWETILRIFN